MRSILRWLGSSIVLVLALGLAPVTAHAKFISFESAMKEARQASRERLKGSNVRVTGAATVTLRKFSQEKGGAFFKVSFPVKAQPGAPNKVVVRGWIDMRTGAEAPVNRIDFAK